MNTSIPFLDQFSALLGSVPSVANLHPSTHPGDGFQSTLQSVLMSQEALIDSVALPIDEIAILGEESMSIDFNDPMIEVDGILDRVDVDLVMLEPGNSVPVEGMWFDVIGESYARIMFAGVNGQPVGVSDTSSFSEEPLALAGSQLIQSSAADPKAVSLPHARFQSVNPPFDTANSFDGAPFQSNATTANIPAKIDVSLLGSDGSFDAELSGAVRDLTGRVDLQSSDRPVGFSHVELNQGSTNPVMTVHRTSSDAHPLVMSPPAATTLKQTIQFMVNDGIAEAEIQLDPPELGSIMVKLKIEHGQHTHIVFQSSHPSVRDLLSDHVDRLRESLADMGLDFGGVDVEVGSQERNASHDRVAQFMDGLNEPTDDGRQVVAEQARLEAEGQGETHVSTNPLYLINERV